MVIAVYALTGMDSRADGELIVGELYKHLDNYAAYDVECLVFEDEEYPWPKGRTVLAFDFSRLSLIFPKLNTLVYSGDFIRVFNESKNIRMISDSFELERLAYKAKDRGEFEKEEFLYKLGALIDYYSGIYHYAYWLDDNHRTDEAEEQYRKIARKELDEMGDANAHYGYLLHDEGRYAEAMNIFVMYLLVPILLRKRVFLGG